MTRAVRRGPRAARIAIAAAAATATIGGAAACVDLFHSTDFATLCTLDAGACRVEDAAPESSAEAASPAATVDFCAWSPAEARDHAERACGWLGACEGARAAAALGPCMLRAEAAYDCRANPSFRPHGAAQALWSCLAEVTSCAAVSACIFGAQPATCAPVEAGASTSCSPDAPSTTVVQCTRPDAVHPPVAVEPCVLEGRACVAIDPSTAVCAGSTGSACSGARRCIGSKLVACDGALDVGIDCSTLGSGRCVADDAGAYCAPEMTAASCAGPRAIECDEDGGVRGCLDGREVAIDCRALGLRCTPSRAAATIEPLSACAESTTSQRCTGPDECHGDRVRSCAQGRTFEIACASLGLGPCKLAPAGLDPVATCRPP